MPHTQLNGVIRHLRRAVFLRGVQDLTDGQLLDRYIVHREETAFESLVRRHGPMVLGVCRRILRHHHDVEDAFQATFLVLVRKAASIRPKEMVANWLYGVAHNTALKARALAMKRQMMEKQVSETPEPQVKQRDQNGDLQRLLDQELSALPEKYRILVVLCDLEGKTRKEAAEQLGWPEGTVSGRLARARVMLANRVTRYGLVLSGGSLALVLSGKAASASVPAALMVSTANAATLVAAGQAVFTGVISAQV